MAAELEFLYLTTTGWKSGRPHEIEIWFTSLDGVYYVIAEKRERAHWVQNLRRHPRVSFCVGGERFAGTARPLHPERDRAVGERVARLSEAKYGWSDGLIVELRPDFSGPTAA
jgi:deazaflavin-dependent oxidoreductase (nitroreductase family)